MKNARQSRIMYVHSPFQSRLLAFPVLGGQLSFIMTKEKKNKFDKMPKEDCVLFITYNDKTSAQGQNLVGYHENLVEVIQHAMTVDEGIESVIFDVVRNYPMYKAINELGKIFETSN